MTSIDILLKWRRNAQQISKQKKLEEYQRQQDRADTNVSYCETDTNSRASNVLTLLARANDAISS